MISKYSFLTNLYEINEIDNHVGFYLINIMLISLELLKLYFFILILYSIITYLCHLIYNVMVNNHTLIPILPNK